MEWARLALDVVRAVAWPALLLVLALVFRKQLAGLIDGISEVTTPGNFSVKRRVTAARAEAEDASEDTIAAVGAGETPHEGRQRHSLSIELEQYLDLANGDPAGAIAGSWRTVRKVVRDVTRRLGTDRELPAGAYTHAHVRSLVPLGLSEDMVGVARTLSGVRNDVVHGRRVRTTAETALEYLAAASDLLDAVEAVAVAHDRQASDGG